MLLGHSGRLRLGRGLPGCGVGSRLLSEHWATSPPVIIFELGIGEPSGGKWFVTALSLPQAKMELHALGLEVAQIKERQRRETAERADLAQVVLDTKVHRR
jgi:hypothetical protein